MRSKVGSVVTADSAPLLIISGPTACGKTKLAIELAHELDAEIVNADSVQVYRDFDIGSAKPTAEEQSSAPHHLLDVLQPHEQFDVAQYVELADRCIADIRARGKRVIVVGGSTMYLTALLHGLAKMPKSDPSLLKEFDQRDTADLYLELSKSDPAAAKRLHPNDRQRIERALQVTRLGAKTLSEQQAQHCVQAVRYAARIFVMCWPRANLYERINQRTQQMLASGLIEETRSIVERHGEACPALSTLGYAQVIDHLKGELPTPALESMIAQQTRRFAKRQLTYWRNEPVKRGWGIEPVQRQSLLRKHGELLEFETLRKDIGSLVELVGEGRGPGAKLWYLDG